jgi:hypothetical protein
MATNNLSPIPLPAITPEVVTLARWMARKAVKAEWLKAGLRIWDYEASDLTKAAKAYLSEHPDLVEQAAETVRNDPRLRTLAERQARQRKANHL